LRSLKRTPSSRQKRAIIKINGPDKNQAAIAP
jgi:hypothetical protein